jgi:uncharacterized Zn finger protein
MKFAIRCRNCGRWQGKQSNIPNPSLKCNICGSTRKASIKTVDPSIELSSVIQMLNEKDASF